MCSSAVKPRCRASRFFCATQSKNFKASQAYFIIDRSRETIIKPATPQKFFCKAVSRGSDAAKTRQNECTDIHNQISRRFYYRKFIYQRILEVIRNNYSGYILVYGARVGVKNAIYQLKALHKLIPNMQKIFAAGTSRASWSPQCLKFAQNRSQIINHNL